MPSAQRGAALRAGQPPRAAWGSWYPQDTDPEPEEQTPTKSSGEKPLDFNPQRRLSAGVLTIPTLAQVPSNSPALSRTKTSPLLPLTLLPSARNHSVSITLRPAALPPRQGAAGPSGRRGM